MPNLTLSWVSDLSDPDGRGNRYVNMTFEEWDDIGYLGKKDLDAAIEVQGLLKERVGVLQTFTLEPAGESKSGKKRWKVTEFGTPGGAATYTAPSVGAASSAGGPAQANPAPAPTTNTEVSIRAAVALKAAVRICSPDTYVDSVLATADIFDEWLQRKASEPASSEYRQVEDDSPSHAEQPAGAGSDDSSAGVFESSLSAPADSAVEGGSDSALGKAEQPESPTPHQHDWQPHPNLRNWLKCECGEARKTGGYR